MEHWNWSSRKLLSSLSLRLPPRPAKIERKPFLCTSRIKYRSNPSEQYFKPKEATLCRNPSLLFCLDALLLRPNRSFHRLELLGTLGKTSSQSPLTSSSSLIVIFLVQLLLIGNNMP
ncbi:hypothetical protein L6164_035662 [Bauhinia variegata]|uniref:Uncharacterized protein n=1 Tax=Bauhinia variegata TaxID=167791 RepID=A0ACB9KEQ0_BAUVA|nr:hypothetical protein L6164_035662 [Bauhinia variegata]